MSNHRVPVYLFQHIESKGLSSHLSCCKFTKDDTELDPFYHARLLVPKFCRSLFQRGIAPLTAAQPSASAGVLGEGWGLAAGPHTHTHTHTPGHACKRAMQIQALGVPRAEHIPQPLPKHCTFPQMNLTEDLCMERGRNKETLAKGDDKSLQESVFLSAVCTQITPNGRLSGATMD